ncbi:MAG: Trk family potassium uptake protein [Nitrospinota bacterium]|nr:MAG: Trk family potassium uptake protein [Nitrospinota bacterium]
MISLVPIRSGVQVFLHLKPTQLIAVSFFLTICLGTLLLMLPVATTSGQSPSFIDALFTATSAVCVTGLVVVDTPTYFSRFGQIVILLLIQIGGLGIMTFSTSLALLLGKRIGIREKAVMQDYLNEMNVEQLKVLVIAIIKMTLFFEALGTLLLSLRWYESEHRWGPALYRALFHAVSAFNNAGFALYSDSLIRFRTDPVLVLTIALLIIFGGLGFTVIFDLKNARFRQKAQIPRLSLHTKLVLSTTGLLLLAGTLSFFLAEYQRALQGLSLGDKLLSAFFHAVTPRTAGFNTLPVATLTNFSLFTTIILMFIGASPGSTGGGVKTSSFALLILTVRAMIQGREEVEAFRRTIPLTVIHRALVVITLSFGIVNLFTSFLLLTEEAPFLPIFFEVVSAFGTVGLSMGLTPQLSLPGKAAITLLMFIGRIGPLTLALAIGAKEKRPRYSYPSERVMVG